MSRTDKEAPWWVAAQWWIPSHNHNCENELRGPHTRPCDLPAAPVCQDRSRTRYWVFRNRDYPCVWEAQWPRQAYRYRYTWGPTKEDRHLMWWRPHRRKVRGIMTHARQLYHGGEEPDVITPRHHRHAPDCNGWWD